MASCFTDAQPVNPINQLLIDAFGLNYAPPYSAAVQPIPQVAMGNEPLLKFDFPGGGSAKPPGLPQISSIMDHIGPMTSILSQVFTFLGPLFIIIDIIRLIIDVICSLLNPIPLITAVIALILGLLPFIALFPVFALVLMALNMVKIIVSIIVSMLSVLVPIIELILRDANSIATLLAPPNFNIAAVDGVVLKICTLLQHLDNQLGAFTPISLILEIFAIFSALGSQLPCTPGSSDSPCCDDNNCPPFVVNPAAGRATVLSKNDVQFIITLLTQPIADLLGLSNSMVLQLDTATSSANSEGLLSSKGIGSAYSQSELLAGSNYVVDPNKISSPPNAGPAHGPATPYSLAIKMVRRSDGATRTARIKSLKVSTSNASKVMVEVDRDDFDPNDILDYTIIPDMNSLLGLNLIGLGCVSSVAIKTQGLINQVNADVPAIAAVRKNSLHNDVHHGLSSFRDKTGLDFPPPPTDALTAVAQKIHDDNTTDITDEIKDVLLNYLDEVTNYYDTVLCIGASRLKSDFSVNKTTVISDGYDSATISLTIKEFGGAPLLTGLLPNSTATAEFYTTNGTVGPVILDELTGTYKATLTSITRGDAEITAAFIINNNVCTVPGIFDGFTVSDKILRINFIPEEEAFIRRRPANQYVQSGRGKRR